EAESKAAGHRTRCSWRPSCTELALAAVRVRGTKGSFVPARRSHRSCAPMRRAALILLPLVPACNEHPLQPIVLTTTSEHSSLFCAAPAPSVDVLIVMDEAPSMVEEVPAIASGLELIGLVYESATRRLDF